MSDPGKPESDSQSGQRHADWRWRRSVRWFVGEFLVVLVGILVALALNAWWDGRQAAEREQAFLKQLRSDLMDTETRGRQLTEVSSAQSLAAARVTQAFWRSQPPDKAALLRDLDEASFVYGELPTMGSVNAVAKSGHLELVSDPALRAHILEYADRTDGDVIGQLYFLNQYVARGVEALNRSSVDLIAIWATKDKGDASSPFPPGPRVEPYPLDVETIRHDRDVYRAYRYFYIANHTQLAINQTIIKRTKALRLEVEQHINR